MSQFTGYLLGKVQVEGAVRSEVLAALVESLVLKSNPVSEGLKKPIGPSAKFSEKNKYFVECSERGLKLTSPGCRAKDEGFESDCESLRSIRGDLVQPDLTDLFDQLEISSANSVFKDPMEEKGNERASVRIPTTLLDTSSISSSSGLHTSSDDSHSSSSGNGSDSDDPVAIPSSGERSPATSSQMGAGISGPPSWELITPVPSFQTYPIEDIVFCHCDSTHTTTLVWMVRALSNMVALVTFFRTKSEAQELFNTYRELRLRLKPVKFKGNSSLHLSTQISTSLTCLNSATLSCPPPSNFNISCSSLEPPSPKNNDGSFFSLPFPLFPPEGFVDNSPQQNILNKSRPKSLGDFTHAESAKIKSFRFGDSIGSSKSNSLNAFSPEGEKKSVISGLRLTPFYFSPDFDQIPPQGDEEDDIEDEDDQDSENEEGSDESGGSDDSKFPPTPPQRKYFTSKSRPIQKGGSGRGHFSLIGKTSSSGNRDKSQPVLLVPLKTENLNPSKSSYPKESYLYKVMGSSSSSTFAPYQRTLNFIPSSSGYNNGSEQVKWGVAGGRQQLVPFSSWIELSEGNGRSINKSAQGLSLSQSRTAKGRVNPRKVSTISVLAPNGKGSTSKILLRDASGNPNGVWATLSQRFKRNIRENLVKLNNVWPQGEGQGRKKKHKKVTFNAWATVQMV